MMLTVSFHEQSLQNTVYLIFLSSFYALGRDYPFYGVQWHPEKNSFEWTSAEGINHSKQAVLVTQYVADFFVNQGVLLSMYFRL